jgi:hypothetical protein
MDELVGWYETLRPQQLGAIGSDDHCGRCSLHAQELTDTPELLGLSLDVQADRDESIADELGDLGVAIHLGFQPSTGRSHW